VSRVEIAGRAIGANRRPYLIAEMSGNHNRSLDRALAIVEAAARSGADAIKLQTYTADTMTLNVRKPGFVIEDTGSLWAGRQLHELYDEAHTPWDWHAPIMRRANELGLQCFSTPFDETAVDFLESLGVPAYKIASFEVTDLPLIRRVAATGKPMIVSLGAWSGPGLPQISAPGGVDYLHCVSEYPAPLEHLRLSQVDFRTHAGFSDHSVGTVAACAAFVLGARILEKHMTFDKSAYGPDHACSMTPDELAGIHSFRTDWAQCR
jgi:N-acetylneuraminate synthase